MAPDAGPKKANRAKLLGILRGYAPDEPGDSSGLRPSDIVTYHALTSVMQAAEERHNGLVALMHQGFKNLEESGRARSEQITAAENRLSVRITDEVGRGDKRYGWIMGGLGLAIVAEIVRFFMK